MTNDKIQMTKILLFLSFFCCLSSVLCPLVFSADLVVESDSAGNQGKLKADTSTFIEQSGVSDGASAPSGSEGRLAYSQSDSALCLSDGATWHIISGASTTIATRIVAVDRNRDSVVDAGDSLTPEQADYVCDGTDDQVEIQQAIDDLGATGGAVYLLDGTYNISGSITMQSNIALIGAGASTVLQLASGASSINVINASSASGILISQLMIEETSSGNGNTGIYFSGVTYSNIAQVWAEGGLQTGISLSFSSSNNTLSGNNVQGNGYGIYLSSSSSNNTLSGNNVQGNYTGIYLGGSSSNNTLSGNNVQGNTGNVGVYLYGSSNNTLSGNNVQGNGTGIYLYSSSNNNTLSGNNVQGNSPGIYLYSSSNNTFSGNNVQGNIREGILLSSSSNDNIISGNAIYDNARDGINIGTNNNLISSNRISKSGTATTYYGINIASGTGNYLSANFIDGTGFAAKISDSGTNTRYTGKDKITLEPVTFVPADGGKIILSSASGTSPASYIRLNPSVNVTLGDPAIDDGKSAGDVLILENISATKTVKIYDYSDTHSSNAYLSQDHIMGKDDTLKLIWNGADWIEVSYAAN